MTKRYKITHTINSAETSTTKEVHVESKRAMEEWVIDKLTAAIHAGLSVRYHNGVNIIAIIGGTQHIIGRPLH